MKEEALQTFGTMSDRNRVYVIRLPRFGVKHLIARDDSTRVRGAIYQAVVPIDAPLPEPLTLEWLLQNKVRYGGFPGTNSLPANFEHDKCFLLPERPRAMF
jgi:hypothetical protein